MVQIEVRERPLFEVANTYEMRSTELLRVAREELHLNVKSHMSVLTLEQYEALIKYLDETRKTKKKPAEKATDGTKKNVVRRAVKKPLEKSSLDVRKAMQTPGPEDVPPVPTAQAPVESGPKLSRKTMVRKSGAEKRGAASAAIAAPLATQPLEKTEKSLDSAVVVAPPDPAAQRSRLSRARETPPPPPPELGVPDRGRATPEHPAPGVLEEEVDRDLLKRPTKKLVQKTEVFHPVDYLKREQVYRTKRKRISRSSGLMSATPLTTPAAHKRVVIFRKPIEVKDLAHQMKVKAKDVLGKLKQMGSVVDTPDHKLDFETAALVAQEYQYEVQDQVFTEERFFKELTEKAKDAVLEHRPPVVTVMGHVDHGKTSILDVLRQTNVVSGEAGGITQHIGAYTILRSGKPITFIDTPGHAAFTAMRKRGASVTDLVVLVVAANDGVMPQTKEAIEHAKAAKVPVMVAVNKMDLPTANLDKVRNQLSEHGLVSEEWGGDTIFVPVSALKKEGLDRLCESILLVAEMNEIRAKKDIYPAGVVIESRLDKSRGPLVTLIVTQGVFKVGDEILSDVTAGRIRQLRTAAGEGVETAEPGYAVEISGLSTVVPAGAKVVALPSATDVQELLDYRKDHHRTKAEGVVVETPPASVEDLLSQIGKVETKKLRFVIKTDVQGSEEALRGMVEGLKVETGPEINIVSSGCGPISESDVDLAKAAGAILVAFHTKVDSPIRKKIELGELTLIESNIIYEVVDRILKIIESGKEPEWVTEELGVVEVRQLIKAGKAWVAGSYVKTGKITRNAMVRIKREGKELGVAKVVSLRRFKDDAREVEAGYECGIVIDFSEGELHEGDLLEAYRQVEKRPEAS